MRKYKKILRYLIPHWPKITYNVIFNILSTIFSVFSLTMIIPFLGILFETQPIVETPVPLKLSGESITHNFNYYIGLLITKYSEFYALLFIGMLVGLTSLLRNGFKYFAMYHLAATRTGVVKDMRNVLYDKSIDLPLSYYSNERKGDIISRMTNDVQQIELSVISSLEMIFREPITIIVYLTTLFIMSPTLTLFVLVLLPLSGFIIGRIGKTLRSTALKGQSKLGIILATIEETITGLRIIKVFNAEEKIKNRFYSLNSLYTKVMTKMYRRHYLAAPTSEFLGTMVVVIIMIYGGAMVIGGESSLSSQGFIGYIAIFSQIISPAKSFSRAYYNIQKGMASADRIDDIMKAKNTIVEIKNPLPINSFNECIEYKDVSFRYDKENVLNNINLVIPKGKTIALVGQSGAGKSTLVDLLPRILDVTKGEISLDGNNIKNLKIKDLRALMGNVNQEAILFNDNFFNNIAFGSNNVSEEQVIKAAKIANAHGFINKTPNGYYTNIGDSGNKLSGGQRQRVSIARAVLHNPPILILDEATSALDTESEKLVQTALSKVMQNRTSIVIAHRLSTVINADLICVLHEGEIIEKGDHQQLIAKDGIYKKLHDTQMFS